MKRELFNLAAAASLLVLVVLATVWIRSIGVGEAFNWRYTACRATPDGWAGRPRHLCEILTGGNRVTLIYHLTAIRQRDPGRDPPDEGWAFHRRPWRAGSWRPGTLSFTRLPDGGAVLTASAPLWLATALAAVLPAVALRRAHQRSTRDRRGLCRSCGYDLRATHDRCPECGLPADTSTPEQVRSP